MLRCFGKTIYCVYSSIQQLRSSPASSQLSDTPLVGCTVRRRRGGAVDLRHRRHLGSFAWRVLVLVLQKIGCALEKAGPNQSARKAQERMDTYPRESACANLH